MDSCIFCKIAAGTIPATLVHEDARCVGFLDAHPQAPFHALFIPRTHLATLNDAGPGDIETLGALVLAARNVAQARGYSASGYRLALNTNRDAGQSVFHIHLHLLAGRALGWPPG